MKKLFELTKKGHEKWRIRAESIDEFKDDIENGWKIKEVKENE